MAQIFRVERTKNFTVMSNHHFKNVSAKYSCGFSNLLDSSIIVNER